MAVKKILTIQDKKLYQKSSAVKTFDKKLRDNIRDMFDTMYDSFGVGLAGVQIGLMKRMMVIDLEEAGFIKGSFVNPKVLEVSEEMQDSEEGCLSVPGISVPLKRPKWVKISYNDLSGQEKTIEGEKLLARALLHEMDHMDGRVFVDLLEPDIKKQIKKDVDLIKKGKLPLECKVPDYREKAVI